MKFPTSNNWTPSRDNHRTVAAWSRIHCIFIQYHFLHIAGHIRLAPASIPRGFSADFDQIGHSAARASITQAVNPTITGNCIACVRGVEQERRRWARPWICPLFRSACCRIVPFRLGRQIPPVPCTKGHRLGPSDTVHGTILVASRCIGPCLKRWIALQSDS